MADEKKESGTSESGKAKVNATSTTARVWAVPTLQHDFNKRYDSLIDALDDVNGNYIDFLGNHQNELVIYFSIANEILKELTETLYTENIVADFTDGGINQRTVVNELSRNKVQEHLVHFNVLESSTKDKIKKAQSYRDRLVHEPQKRHKIKDLSRVKERIDEAKEAVEGVKEMIE